MTHTAQPPDVLTFGAFRFDAHSERLWHGSDPISLRPKTWQVLRYLVGRAGMLIPKRELLDAVWGDVVVEEKALNTCIGEIRAALGDSSRHPRFVETVQRRGFRFLLPAAGASAVDPSEARAGQRFIGRQPELTRLRARLSERVGAPMTVISGAAGIGKSRLLRQAVEDVGVAVLVGQCVEGGGVPYLPWVEMIREQLRQERSTDWRADLGSAAEELERLIPGLVASTRSTLPPSTDHELARLRLFEAIAAFLEAACRSRSLVLVVEDIHWIDNASLSALQALLPRLASADARVLATLRDEDAAPGSTVRAALDGLVRRQLVEALPLSGLALSETRELIATLASEEIPVAIVDRIATSSEGSPFFVEQMLRHYCDAPRDAEAGPLVTTGDLPLPDNIVEVFERRLRHLSPTARRLLEAVAVAGRDCDEVLLQSVMNKRDVDLLGAIDEAIAQNFLRESRPGRYCFVHALMSLAIYQRLTPPRRRAWHRSLAEAMSASLSAEDERISEVARHLYRAVPVVSPETATDALAAAGESAAARLAYEDAIEHYALALALAREDRIDRPIGSRRAELAVRYAEALQKVGESAQVAQAFRDAAEEARAGASAEWFARAALGMATIFDFEAPDVRHYLEEALSGLGERDPALRARLLARLAVVLYPIASSRRRCEELSTEAVQVARSVGSPTLLAQTLVDWLAAQWYQDNLAVQDAVSRELAEVARESGDAALVATARGWRTVIAMGRGEVDEAADQAAALARLAAQLGQPLYRWCGLYLNATMALLRGELARAESLANEAFEYGRHASPQAAMIVYSTQIIKVRREQDRMNEILPLIEQNPSRITSDSVLWSLPHFYVEADRLDDARAAFARVLALGFDDLPGENSRNRRLMTVGAMGLACAALDDRDTARSLYALLLPDARRWGVAGFGAVNYGLLDNALGALATCLGDFDASAVHFESAIAEYEQKRVPISLARAYLLYAEMCLRRRASGDTPRAAELLGKAAALADPLGLARVQTLVGRLRARL